jgi:hypothetical protein
MQRTFIDQRLPFNAAAALCELHLVLFLLSSSARTAPALAGGVSDRLLIKVPTADALRCILVVCIGRHAC